MPVGAGALRLWTNYFDMAANTNLQPFTFETLDDFRVRHIQSVYVGLATAGISIALFTSGQEYSVVDLSRFANGDAPVYVDIDVMAKLQLTVGFRDIAGAGATGIPVIIGYTVDPGSGA